MGHFLCGKEMVKRFVNVHLHCIVSNLEIIRKVAKFPLPGGEIVGKIIANIIADAHTNVFL